MNITCVLYVNNPINVKLKSELSLNDERSLFEGDCINISLLIFT